MWPTAIDGDKVHNMYTTHLLEMASIRDSILLRQSGHDVFKEVRTYQHREFSAAENQEASLDHDWQVVAEAQACLPDERQVLALVLTQLHWAFWYQYFLLVC